MGRSLVAAALVLLVPAGFAQSVDSGSERLIAAAQIYALHGSILGFESACRKWGSASLPAITSARSAWEQKHALVLAAANRVLAAESSQHRAQLAADLDEQNMAMEHKVESAPPEEREQWCHDFPQRLASAAMDPGNSPAYRQLMH